MAVEVRPAHPDDLAEMVAVDYRNFGHTVSPGDVEAVDKLLDLDRFVVAVDGDRIVGLGGTYQMELTVPGGTTVPCSGVTWVSVLASHRRRGILRSMMESLDELAAELEEPALALTASEGPIYERFGYGVATRTRAIVLDRRRAQIDSTQLHRSQQPEPVDLVFAADHVDEMLAIYDRYRVTQPGEVSRSEALFRELNLQRDKPVFAALHPDGYAIWEIEPDWQRGHPAHKLAIVDFVAATPVAHVSLWHVLLSVDLVGPIRSFRAVGPGDPLPSFLTDPRALRTIEDNDGLWVKVADAVTCFGARSYRTDDRLTVGVVEDRLAPELGSASATEPAEFFTVGSDGPCHSDGPADLLATRAALGPLLLGVSATELAAGGRVTADDKILERADVLLGSGRRAHCRTGF